MIQRLIKYMFCDCRNESGLAQLVTKRAHLGALDEGPRWTKEWWRKRGEWGRKKERKERRNNAENGVRPVGQHYCLLQRLLEQNRQVTTSLDRSASPVQPVVTGRPCKFQIPDCIQQAIPISGFLDHFSKPILMIFGNPTHLCRRGARHRTNPSGFVSIGATDWSWWPKQYELSRKF